MTSQMRAGTRALTSEERDTNVQASSDGEQPKPQLLSVETQVMELQLQFLQARDYAIGAAAEVGEVKVRLTTKERELANALIANHEKDIHIANHVNHISRLESRQLEMGSELALMRTRSVQLDRVYASRTWKLGRILLLPVRVLRRLLRSP